MDLSTDNASGNEGVNEASAPETMDQAVESAIALLKEGGEGQGGGDEQSNTSSNAVVAEQKDAGDGAEHGATKNATDKHEKDDTSAALKLPPKPQQSEWMQLRTREKAVREKEAAWEQERAQLKEQASLAERIKKSAQDDVHEALKLMGYDDPRKFLEYLADTGGKLTPEQKRQRELEQRVASFEQEKKERAEQEAKRAEQAKIDAGVENWHKSIAEHIKTSDKHKESLVTLPDTERAVFQIMQKHYEETGGEEMPISDAVDIANQNMESYASNLLGSLAGNARGLAILRETVAKHTQQGAARQKAPGIQAVRNQTPTRAASGKLRPLDEVVDEVIAQM